MKLQDHIVLLAALAIILVLVLLYLDYTIDAVKIPGVVEINVSPPDKSSGVPNESPDIREENPGIPKETPTSTAMPAEPGWSEGGGITPTLTATATVPPPVVNIPNTVTPRILFENVSSDTNGDGKTNLEDNRVLMMTDINGSHLIPLTNDSFNARDASWSPDGKSIIFSSNVDGDFDIYTRGVEEDSFHIFVGNDGFDDRGPSWSPDNQWIAFYSDRDGDSEIYLIRPDGSDLRQLTFNDHEDEYPTWAPNASQIAYQSGSNCPTEDCRIYILSLDGQDPELYLDYLSFWPSWSPNGQYFGASIVTKDDNAKIHTWDMTSKEEKIVDADSSTGQNWSPDSSQMAYVKWESNGPQIWIMNSDGSNHRRLTSNGYNTRPVFSP